MREVDTRVSIICAGIIGEGIAVSPGKGYAAITVIRNGVVGDSIAVTSETDAGAHTGADVVRDCVVGDGIAVAYDTNAMVIVRDDVVGDDVAVGDIIEKDTPVVVRGNRVTLNPPILGIIR